MRSLFLITYLVLCHNTIGAGLVEPSCRKAAEGNKNLNYSFCVSTLNRSPNSKGADLAGLTGIVVDLTSAKAKSIKSTISKLMSDPKVDNTALKDCEKLYSNALDGLQTATDALKSRNFGTALTYLSSTLNAPETCETGFKEKKTSSPLASENREFKQLTMISLAFTNQLKAG